MIDSEHAFDPHAIPSLGEPISEQRRNGRITSGFQKSTWTIGPLQFIYWVSSVVCASFLLRGFNYFNVHEMKLTSSFVSDVGNSSIGVTPEFLSRVHARFFYNSNSTRNSTSIALFKNNSTVDDKNVISLKAVRGQVYVAERFSNITGYKLTKRSEMDKFRLTSPVHMAKDCVDKDPKPWLGEFRNVWMDGNGDIYIPVGNSTHNRSVDVLHYSIQGGCCEKNWRNAVNERQDVQVNHDCRHKLAFSITQYHGKTYSHILHEVLPRLFSFWNAAHSVLKIGGVIAVGKHSLLPSILQDYFGILSNQIVLVNKKEPCFFEKVIVPEAWMQGSYSKSCVTAATENVLKTLMLERESRPLILLMERAYRRSSDGKCHRVRCLANFHELRNAIISEFGDRVVVETFGPENKGGIRKTAKLFNRATVVIGVHGAGFANMLYMRQWGSHMIHLGWEGRMWQFYAKKAHARGINFVNVLTPGASQNAEDIEAEIPVILAEIRSALKKEDYKVHPLI